MIRKHKHPVAHAMRQRQATIGNAKHFQPVFIDHIIIVARKSTCRVAVFQRGNRSEEHTSELQSLMRISYAVFCLKKKKTTTQSQKTKDPIFTTMTLKSQI